MKLPTDPEYPTAAEYLKRYPLIGIPDYGKPFPRMMSKEEAAIHDATLQSVMEERDKLRSILREASFGRAKRWAAIITSMIFWTIGEFLVAHYFQPINAGMASGLMVLAIGNVYLLNTILFKPCFKEFKLP